MRLLGRASSLNVRKVAWCLAEIGVEAVREDWGRGHASPADPAFRALNPNARVPVLVDGGAVIWESNAILRYLCAAYGEGRHLPREPAARARVEMWMDWQLSAVQPALHVCFQGLVVSPGSEAPERIAAAARDLGAAMGVLDGRLAAAGPFLGGDAPSAADFAVGVAVHRWRSLAVERPERPAVATYHGALRAHAAFARHVAGWP